MIARALVFLALLCLCRPCQAPARAAGSDGEAAQSPCCMTSCDIPKEKTMDLSSLPKGLSGWVYRYREGVAKQITLFSSFALPKLRFAYLFPYGGSIGFPGEKGTAEVSYRGTQSAAYAEALPPGLLIMPIVDGRTDGGEFDGWTDEQYAAAARLVADKVIADPNAAGVQVDIEPFDPGQLPFYRHLTEDLNAAGKVSTMFVGPWNDEVLARIFDSCDVVVMSGYDVAGEGSSLDAYSRAMQAAVPRFQQMAEKTGKRYMIGIPAAASWGEFEFEVGGDAPRVDTGVRQEQYVQAALDAVKPFLDSPQYIGLSLWHLSDPDLVESPDAVTERTKFPAAIPPSVWKMLEQY